MSSPRGLRLRPVAPLLSHPPSSALGGRAASAKQLHLRHCGRTVSGGRRLGFVAGQDGGRRLGGAGRRTKPATQAASRSQAAKHRQEGEWVTYGGMTTSLWAKLCWAASFSSAGWPTKL